MQLMFWRRHYLGPAGIAAFALVLGVGAVMDCGELDRHTTSTETEVDLETVPDYAEEARELGLIQDPESPWGPPQEGAQRRRWIELGATSIDATSEFAPPEDLLVGVSGPVTVFTPSTFDELQTLFADAGSVVVLVAEYAEEGRAAVALTIAQECQQAGRHCFVSVAAPGRVRQATRVAQRAAEDGVSGLLERLQEAAKNDEPTFLFRIVPESTPMRLAEFRP